MSCKYKIYSYNTYNPSKKYLRIYITAFIRNCSVPKGFGFRCIVLDITEQQMKEDVTWLMQIYIFALAEHNIYNPMWKNAEEEQQLHLQG